MKSYLLPGDTKKASRLIMGTMIINTDNYENSCALLDAAMDLGINTFDAALVYGGGGSERALGKWMEERGNREDVYIITKGAHHNADRKRVTPYDITSDLMDSLARLRTNYIDVYILHRDDPDMDVGPIVEILSKHKDSGLIRAFGASNWTHGRIKKANEYAAANNMAPMSVTSPNYSLCEQIDDPWGPGCVTIGGPAGEEARRFYQENDIPILAYSSLGRGMFSGRVTRGNYKDILDGAAIKAYAHEINFKKLDRAHELAEKKGVSVPQIALAYILYQPFKAYPIVGAASVQELNEAVCALEIILTANELAWLDNG